MRLPVLYRTVGGQVYPVPSLPYPYPIKQQTPDQSERLQRRAARTFCSASPAALTNADMKPSLTPCVSKKRSCRHTNAHRRAHS